MLTQAARVLYARVLYACGDMCAPCLLHTHSHPLPSFVPHVLMMFMRVTVFCLCDVLLAAQIDYSHPIVLYISARFVISPAGSV